MLSFESPQFEEIALASFEQRVRSWVQAQALHPGLRQLAAQGPRVTRLWAPQRHRLSDCTEHDAAVLLSFVLACELEGIVAAQGVAQALVQPQPEMAMKRFLSERGYLRFSDFDLPLQDD